MTGVLPWDSPGIVVLAARRIASETAAGEAESAPELAPEPDGSPGPEVAVSFEDRLVRARARRRAALAARGGEPAPPRPAWLRPPPPEALARAIPAVAPEVAPVPEARGFAPPAGEGRPDGAWYGARRVVAAALLGLGALMTAPRQAGDPVADAGVGAAAGGGAEASAAQYAAPAPPEFAPVVLGPAPPPGALAGRFVMPAAAAPPLVPPLVDPRGAEAPPGVLSPPPRPGVAVTAPAQGRAPVPPAFPAMAFSGPDGMAPSFIAAGAPEPLWIPASGGADGPVPPAAAARPPAVPEGPPTTATMVNPGANPGASTAPDTVMVFVHVPPGVAPARVARLLAALRAGGHGEARVIPVGFAVARGNLRFYHAADRARAARLWSETAPAIAGPRYASPRDFTSYTPSPRLGTIEFWLAGG